METAVREYLDLSSNIYAILARPWYMELTNKWLKGFNAHRPVFEALSEQLGNANLSRGAELMKTVPCEIDEQAYAKKFPYLFLGVDIGQKSITAHESAYLSPKGLIKQDEWESVFEFFCNESVGIEDFKEPEDHITSEFHFLALLGRQAAEYAAAGEEGKAMAKLKSRLRFLAEHTLKWTDKLSCHMLKLTDDSLYSSIAYLTDGFPRADNMIIEAAVYNETDTPGEIL